LLFQRNVAFLVIIVGIFGSLLMPVLSIDFAFATSDGDGGDTGSGGDNGGGDNGEGGGGGDEPDPEPELEPEPEPEPSPDPGIVPGPEPLVDPCLENPEAEGCASEPPVDPCIENPNAEGCEPDPGLVGPTPQPMPPYEGCLLDPTLPECTPPPGGKCPPGTLMNGYGQCYPDKPCPPGYARADDDETGACLPINTPTPTPTPTPGGNCDPSYSDKCIPSPPPDLDCNDISFRNFKVIGSDPHGFDRDSDGIGCEGSGNGSSGGGGGNGNGCDPSYPEDCIPSPPPDLDCGDDGVPNNVKVLQPDPHRLDGDKDGVGCEGSSYSGGGNGNSNNGGGSSSSTSECQGQADCFRGTVTEIVDGDTLDINNVRVRLALINTPERGQSGYTEAIDFVQSVCDVGTTALVDEDDGQKEGSFDRLIGLVYCGEDNINNKKSLNELLLEGGYAVIYQDFCGISEFSSAGWAQSRGC
jgi:hypothetical protein